MTIVSIPNKLYGVDISCKREDLGSCERINIIVHSIKPKKLTLDIPIMLEEGVRFYSGIYGNPIYGVSPPTPDGIPRINGLDGYHDPRSAEGEYILSSEDDESPNTLIKAVDNKSEFADLFNLDTWAYCRATDIIGCAVTESIKETVQKLMQYNTWDGISIRMALQTAMNCLRYVGHVATVKDYKVRMMSRQVMIGPVFQRLNSPNGIHSSSLDWSDCPQSAKFDQFTLRKGAELQGKELTSAGNNLFSEDKYDVAFLKWTEGKRRVVLRSRHNALDLLTPDKPKVYEDEMNPCVPSLNVLTVRCQHPAVLNDSAIVSKSFVSRAGAIREIVQTIKVPKNAGLEWLKSPAEDQENAVMSTLLNPPMKQPGKESVISMLQSELPSSIRMWNRDFSIVKRGDRVLAVITEGPDGPIVKHIVTNVKTAPGMVLVSCDEEPSINPDERIFTLLYRGTVPLKIGDKLMNQTGHKFTVGLILPDDEMPMVSERPADLVMPFEIGKRCTPSSWLEEAMSMLPEKTARSIMKTATTASRAYRQAVRKGAKPVQAVVWNNEKFNAPCGYLRIFRTSHIPSESLKWTIRQVGDPRFNYKNSVRVTWSMLFAMRTRGADRLINWLLSLPKRDGTNVSIWEQTMNAFSGKVDTEKYVRVWKYLPSSSIRSVATIRGKHGDLSHPAFNNTVLDQRMRSGKVPGYIRTYAGPNKEMLIPLPPFASNIHVMDDDSYLVGSLLRSANRIIRLTEYYKSSRSGERLTQINMEKRRYSAILRSYLVKQIDRFNNPNTGSCVYAVLTSDPTLEYNQIAIPEKVFRAFSRSNKMFKDNPIGMFFRQPVHSHCELVAVDIVPRKGETIGVHPGMIELFRGDFDGDAGFVVIPEDYGAYQDLKKIRIEDVLKSGEYWQRKKLMDRLEENMEFHLKKDESVLQDDGTTKMVEVPITEPWEVDYTVLGQVSGISSWPGNCKYESLDPRFNSMWLQPVDSNDILQNSLEGGFKMGKIKTDTGYAGGAALAFLGYLKFHAKSDFLKYGLEFYRMSAEDALKSKSGGGSVVADLFSMYVSARRTQDGPQIPGWTDVSAISDRLLRSAGHSHRQYPKMAKLLYGFLGKKARFQNTEEFNNWIHPLIAMMRGSRSAATVREWFELNCPLTIFEASR